jgi:TonB family protein
VTRAGALAAALAVALAAAADPDVGAAPPRHQDLAPAGAPLASRLAEIQRRVQDAVRYPELARARGIAGEARVAFEIGSDGRAIGLAVVESSGSLALDRAAEQAVRDAGELPHVAGRVNVPVRFALVESH